MLLSTFVSLHLGTVFCLVLLLAGFWIVELLVLINVIAGLCVWFDA